MLVTQHWFPGAVVTHNGACSLALDPFKSAMSAWLWGSHADGSILKGGSDQGQAGMRLQSWGQFLKFLLKPVLN